MRFKQYLGESMKSMVPVDISSFALSDLLKCYVNSGYELSAAEKASYISSKYTGFKMKKHVFAVLWHDVHEDEFNISEFYVELGKTGLVSESEAMPSYTSEDEDEALKKFRDFK